MQYGRNHGQTLKIQWFLSNEFYMDTHWQDCRGKDNSRKFHWNLEEELEPAGESSQVCSQIVLKCWFLARIGRPDMYGLSTNLQEQSQNGLRLATDVWQD